MKKTLCVAASIFIALLVGAQAPKQFSLIAKIYTAKKIITMNPANSIYTDSPAIAVGIDGKIDSIGTLSMLTKLYPIHYVDNTFINDVIMPGFVEAHTHLQSYGMNASLPYTGYFSRPGLNGKIQKGITTRDSIILYLRSQLTYSAKAKDTLPMFANGADPIYFNCSRFTSQFLDSVSARVPIVMQLGSGHIVICNTPMMNVLKNMSGWSTLPPHTVDSLNGAPTGELDESAGVELALFTLDSLYKAACGTRFYNPTMLVAGVKNGALLMSQAGITTATELLFTAPSALLLGINLGLYRSAADESLPVRVLLGYDGYALYNNFKNYWPDSSINFLKWQKGLDNNTLKTGPVKFIFDGSIQGYTAQVDKPYISQPQNPFWNIQPSSLADIMRPFLQNGFPVAIHANGDSAIGLTIAALASLQSANTAPGIWATLEHDQLTKVDQFKAVSKMHNVGVNLFMNHIYYYGLQHAACTVGWNMASMMDDAYMADTMGIPYSLHSDAPITPAQPLFAAWIATHRVPANFPGMKHNGEVFGDTITTQKALYAITMGGAKLLNLDSELGSLEKGKWADFAILSGDPYNLQAIVNAPNAIVGTMKGGIFFSAGATAQKKRKK